MGIKTKEGYPKARKEHKCNYCRHTINVGVVYYHYSTLEAGEWVVYKLHVECEDKFFACLSEVCEHADHWEEWNDQDFV